MNKLLLHGLTLTSLTAIQLIYHFKNRKSSLPSPKLNITDFNTIKTHVKECDIFTGQWIRYERKPYYTNQTCELIIDQHNCLKFGRVDTEFMKWRWKPDKCELPLFDAFEFLKIVRGKSMAFVGDSVGRNQMQSLLCLLATVAYPEDVTRRYTADTKYFKHYLFKNYSFKLSALWSPFLVKANDTDPNGHSLNSQMSLHLDQPDESWLKHIERFDYDYIIISGGHWFFRPLIYYTNDRIIGCHKCDDKNIAPMTMYDGYRLAFNTTLNALISLKGYKGVTVLRTFSPSHFENGAWNQGGNCPRTRPFRTNEVRIDGYESEFYKIQVDELKKAEAIGNKIGLKFGLISVTEAMLVRPDGHPNFYGRSSKRNTCVADCVHWCLPGPIDTWNEFLLYLIKIEAQGTQSR